MFVPVPQSKAELLTSEPDTQTQQGMYSYTIQNIYLSLSIHYYRPSHIGRKNIHMLTLKEIVYSFTDSIINSQAF